MYLPSGPAKGSSWNPNDTDAYSIRFYSNYVLYTLCAELSSVSIQKHLSELSESVLKVEFDIWDHWFVKAWRLKKIAKNVKFYIDAKIIQNQFLYQKSMIMEEKLEVAM